eukprot:Amastigsp_a340017_35.p4 type:complete len:135 gc:universal Amastigsp_a340017_35:194-598(+)
MMPAKSPEAIPVRFVCLEPAMPRATPSPLLRRSTASLTSSCDVRGLPRCSQSPMVKWTVLGSVTGGSATMKTQSGEMSIISAMNAMNSVRLYGLVSVTAIVSALAAESASPQDAMNVQPGSHWHTPERPGGQVP